MQEHDIFIKPYPSQFDLRGESITCYGSDFRDVVNYTFNNQGYRSEFDFDLHDPDPIVVCLGSSIATGHGVDLSQCFGRIVAEKLQKKLWNLGQGCFRSNNQTIMEQVEFLINTNLNIELYMIQFTHINRQSSKFSNYLEFDQSVCVKNFETILENISHMLTNKKWCWLLTDWSGAKFPSWIIDHPDKISIDPDIIDHVNVSGYEHLTPSSHALKMLSQHPGPEWHNATAQQIINKLYEHHQPLEK